jgi:hypothetical protein
MHALAQARPGGSSVYAVAVVGGYGAADDPLLSSSVSTQAGALLAQAAAGSVVCKPSVYQACGAIPGLQAQAGGGEGIVLSLNPVLAPLMSVA